MPNAYDEQRRKSPVTPWLNGAFGLVASLGTNFVLYPLDLIKVRLQAKAPRERVGLDAASNSGTIARRGAMRAMVREVASSAGARGFFVGVAPGLVGPALAWGSYLVAYEYFTKSQVLTRPLREREYYTAARLLEGFVPGLIMTLVTNPVFVIKTRLQTAPLQSGLRPTLSSTIHSVVRQEGLRGMYKGMSAALPLAFHAAVHWTIYLQMREALQWFTGRPHDTSLRSWELLALTGSSKLIASSITYPLHVVKTCLQSRAERTRFVDLLRDIVRINGARGFYIGFVPHLMRTVPSSTITMFLVETFRDLYIRLATTTPSK